VRYDMVYEKSSEQSERAIRPVMAKELKKH